MSPQRLCWLPKSVLACGLMLLSFVWVGQAGAETYSQSFTGGVGYNRASQQCSSWHDFKASLRNKTFNSITIRGSRNTEGYTCTGQVANTICGIIANGNSTTPLSTFQCDGQTWNVGSCGREIEVNVGGGMCSCPNNANTGIVRPCLREDITSNTNWGGFNGATCGAPSQTLEVICGDAEPNEPPVVQAISDQTHNEGEVVSLQVQATDANNQQLTYSATNLPDGLSINSSTGLISGTLTFDANDNSPYTVTVSVTDGQDTTERTFTWTVNNTLTSIRVLVLSPGLSDAQRVAGYLNDQNFFEIEAVPVDSDTTSVAQMSEYNVVLSFTNHRPSSNDATGNLYADYIDQGNGGLVEAVFGQFGVYRIGGRWQSENYAVVADTSNSIYTSGSLGTKHQPTHPILAGVNAVGVTNYRTGVTSLRSGAQLLASYTDGQILSGARENKNARIAWVGFFPRDSYNGDALRMLVNSLVWAAGATNNNEPNEPPTVTNPGAQVQVEGRAVNVTVSATDANNDELTFSAQGLPPGLTINSSTGAITGTISDGAANNSPYAVTVTVSDGEEDVSVQFSWKIYNDAAPTVAFTAPGQQWHNSPVSATGTISEPGCDQDPIIQSGGGVTFTLAGANGNWTFSASNIGPGRYSPASITVTSRCNGQETLATRNFGVDTSVPLVIFTQIGQNGVNPNDNTTWPILGDFDEVNMLMQARDSESGVVSVSVTVTNTDTNESVTIHEQTFATNGEPAGGLTLAPIQGCSNEDHCEDGVLLTQTLEGPNQRMNIVITNGAGGQFLNQRYFRKLGLVEAIIAWRDRIAEGLSTEVPVAQAQLDRATAAFNIAIRSGQAEQWGGVSLSLQTVQSALQSARLLDPNLNPEVAGDERDLVGRIFLGLLTSRSKNHRELEGVVVDTLDTADEFLASAAEADEIGTLLNFLANAFFWMEDAAAPMVALNFGDTRTLLGRILEEMDAYITREPELVGVTDIADARTELSEVFVLIERVVANGDLSLTDLEHVRLLLGLTNTAEALAEAQNDGTWVRNWQWGLTQIVYIYAARGLRNAGPFLGINNPVLLAGQAQLELADGFRLERRADDFMRLLIDSRCLIISIYNFAYEPDEVPPVACCEDMLQYRELDPRFPVPQLCTNGAPVMEDIEDQNDLVGGEVSLQVQVEDPDGDDLTYSAEGLPPGLTINESTGLISGTITGNGDSPYTVTVIVSDGFDEDSVEFRWNVEGNGERTSYFNSFVSGQEGHGPVCDGWNDYRSRLDGNVTYTSVTLRGSRNPEGFTCTGAEANNICQRVRTNNFTRASISCGGRTWNLGGCGNSIEVGVNTGGVCSCLNSPNVAIIRPCIQPNNPNWGGLNGPTCSAPSQDIEFICQ